MNLSPVAKFGVATYFILTAWLILLTPNLCFINGQPRAFGFNQDETIFPFYVIALLGALTVYILGLFIYHSLII
jgi:hypothetical protein